MKEVWKKLEKYPRYEVSNMGRIKATCIRGKKVDKILKQNLKKSGYLHVVLYEGGEHYYRSMHRLIAQTFIPNLNNLPEVNHKDGNKTNNCVENLEWCDRSYNVNHAYVTGLKHGLRGKNNPCSKKIVQLDLEGNLIKIWDSSMDIERTLKDINLNQACVIACCLGIAGKKKRITHKGYKWRYYEDYKKDC